MAEVITPPYYICAIRGTVIDKCMMDIEHCHNPSENHDVAPPGPCKHLIVFRPIPEDQQCDSWHYNGGNNVKCVRPRDHAGQHMYIQTIYDGKVIHVEAFVTIKAPPTFQIVVWDSNSRMAVR